LGNVYSGGSVFDFVYYDGRLTPAFGTNTNLTGGISIPLPTTTQEIAANNAQAMLWYQKAAAQGNAAGQERLGVMHIYDGSSTKFAQSLSLFQQSAAQGDMDADMDLAGLYMLGWGVPQDSAKAISLIRQAAAQGNPEGLYTLGLAYFYGVGVVNDINQGIGLVEKASRLGYPFAKLVLPQMEAKLHPVPPADLPSLDRDALQAQADAGYAAAETELGNRYSTGWHCGEYGICEIDKDNEYANIYYRRPRRREIKQR
jgi:TPR repeat protein